MSMHIPRAAVAAAITTAGLLGGATAANAAVTLTFSDGTFTASGDAAADTITVRNGSTPARVGIQVPGQTLADPDGTGSACAASGNTAECQLSSVSIIGNAGNDALADTRTFVGSSNSGSGSGFDVARLNGGAGNDTLTGGELPDTLEPGAGADRVRGGSGPTDPNAAPYKGYLAEGGDPAAFQSTLSFDLVSYGRATSGVTVTLDDQANDGSAGEGDDIGSDVEAVDGSSLNDTLTAGASQVALFGGPGDDTLNGGPEDDLVLGGSGAGGDSGGSGSDSLNGNGGNDFLGDDDPSPFQVPTPGQPLRTPAGTDQLDGGPGDDTLSSDAGPDDLIGGPGQDFAGFERFAPFPANISPGFVPPPIGFTISLDDQANDGATETEEGDNVHSDVEEISTGRAADVLTGSDAANTLISGGGNDAITGGRGLDVISAEGGDDTINVQDGITDRVDGGRGNDSAVADLAGGQPEKADVLLNVENVSGVPLPTVIDVRNVPPAPPPAPAPNTAPMLSVSGLKVKTKWFLEKGTFTLKVTTNEPASVVADLLGQSRFRAIGDIVVGTGRLAAGTGTRNLKVSVGSGNLKTFRRKLRTTKQRKTGVNLRLRIIATDPLGLATTTTKTVKITG
jgi:Ca2+-binding RTX toxin-like protein